MNHELFRHFEMELFVKRRDLPAAVRYLTDILRWSDDAKYELTDETTDRLRSIQLRTAVESLGGQFTHHYPICFRRVLTDDSLISMTSLSSEEVRDSTSAEAGRDDWFAISLITYQSPRERFCAIAGFLADSMCQLFGARVHWGKWFPQTSENVANAYPQLKEFQAVCERFDPQGVFRNRFVRDKVFGEITSSTKV